MYASKLNLKPGNDSFGPPYLSKFPNNFVSNRIAAIVAIFTRLVSLAASATSNLRSFLVPSPFAGSGLPESYKTRAKFLLSNCLALCKFGAARVLQNVCEISSDVQCGFGAARGTPENNFFRSRIEHALCYHVAVYAHSPFLCRRTLEPKMAQ